MWQPEQQGVHIDDGLPQSTQAVVDQITERVRAASLQAPLSPWGLSWIEQLIKEYTRPLNKAVRRLLKSYDATQDIVQDTFIALYFEAQKRPAGWVEQSHIRAWLLRVAKNKALNYLDEKAQKDVTSLDSGQAMLMFEPHVPPFDYPETAAMRDEVNMALYQAVNALRQPRRNVIALRFFYHYSLEELAQELEMPLSTVKSHIFRGKEELRELLAAAGVDPRDLGFWERTQERFPKATIQEKVASRKPALDR